MKSVISLVDSPVRSAHAKRSCIRNKLPTDFSICSILGRESDVSQPSSSSGPRLFKRWIALSTG